MNEKRSRKNRDLFVVLFYSQFDLRQVQFGFIHQVNRHLTDVFIEIVMFQHGERQEARARNNMNAVRCAAQANEGRVHFPFGGGIEEGKFVTFFYIFACIHQQFFRFQNDIGITGVIQRRKLADISMLVAGDLHCITIMKGISRGK